MAHQYAACNSSNCLKKSQAHEQFLPGNARVEPTLQDVPYDETMINAQVPQAIDEKLIEGGIAVAFVSMNFGLLETSAACKARRPPSEA